MPENRPPRVPSDDAYAIATLAHSAHRGAHAGAVAALALEDEQLDEDARDYDNAALSERTRAAYKAHWAAFAAWCAERGQEALPADARTVRRYVTARAKAGRKVATIALDLSAIGYAHQLVQVPSPCTQTFVRTLMAGIRRTHGVAQAQKAPVLGNELRRVADALVAERPNTLIVARDRALLLVGFAGAFRRSELVSLDVGDLQFDDKEGLLITLRRSKTDQEGAGRKVALPKANDPASSACPVRALQTWLRRAHIEHGAVFRSVNRHGRVGPRLSAHRVARIVKHRVACIDLDPATYSGHSLRSGFVTSAAKAGKAPHKIMDQTGHRSIAMVSRYIRDAELFKDNAAAGLL